jgi:sugar phosphate isomerase/epimerase
MVCALRREVDMTDIAGSLQGLKSVPIELALPWRRQDFEATKGGLPEVEDYVRREGLIIAGLHATQGSLTQEDFLSWAIPTQEMARRLGAAYVVYHPNRVARTGRSDMQLFALQKLKELQRIIPEVTVCLETFGGPDRALTPEEIVKSPYPMVLDLSHLDPARSYALIDAHHPRIRTIHVSEVAWHGGYGKTQSHMPAGPVCAKAFELLRQKSWDGTLTLEYLAEFRAQMFTDRQRIEKEWGSR